MNNTGTMFGLHITSLNHELNLLFACFLVGQTRYSLLLHLNWQIDSLLWD